VGKGGASQYHKAFHEVQRILTRKTTILPAKIPQERHPLGLRPMVPTKPLAQILPTGIQTNLAGIKPLLTIEAKGQRLLLTLKTIRSMEALVAVLPAVSTTTGPANLGAVGLHTPTNKRDETRHR
jgi:hypothetical protein